jgi:hypothetical protein
MNTFARTITQIKNRNLVTELKAGLRSRLHRKAADLIGWLFSIREVQEAVAKQINCRTPLGAVLNEHIESACSDLSADDINGLEREIDRCVEHSMEHYEFDAGNINGLKDAIEEAVTEAVNDASNDTEFSDRVAKAAIEEIVDRLRS